MKFRIIFIAVYSLSLLFPLGIWFGLEGYELLSFICLISGWGPLAYFLAAMMSMETKDESAE